MKLLVLALLVLLVVGFIATAVAYHLGHRAAPKPDQIQSLIDQHAEYTGNAAEASRKGHHGEANVWSEAAEDIASYLRQKGIDTP